MSKELTIPLGSPSKFPCTRVMPVLPKFERRATRSFKFTKPLQSQSPGLQVVVGEGTIGVEVGVTGVLVAIIGVGVLVGVNVAVGVLVGV